MRLGMVNRTDLPKGIYIDDIEDTSRRNFSSQPKGQSRYVRRASDGEVQDAITSNAFLAELGTDTNANVDTSTNDTLRIRSNSTAAYTVIAVTSGVTTAKTTIANDLNLAFQNNSLPFLASVEGTNQILIRTTIGTANLDLDTIANGSTLNTPLGFTDGVTQTALTVADLRTAVYPTTTTLDVSSATILALKTFDDLPTALEDSLVEAVADLIAPPFVETSLVLLSFSSGVISKAAASDFQPGGARAGLTAGEALYALDDDGSTAFSL